MKNFRLALIKHCCIACAMFFLPFAVKAQIGGESTFDFLNLSTHGRVIALGGVNVSSQDGDVNMFLANPSLLTDDVVGKFGFGYYGYYAGIGNMSVTYAQNIGKYGPFGFSLQYLNYGSFDGYDATGLPTGEFQARDFAFGITKAHQAKHYRMGISMKFARSVTEIYSASGLFFDLSGTFIHPREDLKVSVVMRNLGFAFSRYSPTSEFGMPFDLLIGGSYKPEKMPLRISLTMHNLTRDNIAYQDPNQSSQIDANGNPVLEEVSTTDKITRYFVIGGEFVLSKNFNVRAGYNFLRRAEMTIEERPAAVGFSFGAMVRLKSLEFSYSRSLQHISGGVNNFTLILNGNTLFAKKKVID